MIKTKSIWRNIITDLLFKIDGHIAVITLNRPDKRNAFSLDLLRMWRESLQEAQQRTEVRVIVVTGAGPDFCAGGDIKNMRARLNDSAIDRKNFLANEIQTIPLTLANVDKPVLAAINGSAAGAGMDMALMCDIRIAGESTKMAERYISAGIMPGAGGAWLLPRIVGTSRALELLWTGRWVKATEALSLGLVNEVVPDSQILEHTLALANRLSEAPPLTIRMMKRSVSQATGMDLRSHLDQISSHMAVINSTDDHREAIDALLEKRKPNFSGR